MAKIASSFHCIVCKQRLNFPNDASITDFVILILQFYKLHEGCDAALSKPQSPPKRGKK